MQNELSTNQVFLAKLSSTVQISIQGVPTRDGVIVNYITSAANQPKTFGNHIYVWQTTTNEIPWLKAPDGDTPINSDSSTGTQMVNFDFEEKGYIIGYAVAPSPQSVCSTIFIPPMKQNNPEAWEYSNVTLDTVYHGTNLVQEKYTGLSAYQPATNRNWVGIWQGGMIHYFGNPIGKVNITNDVESGYATIQGIKLLIGTTYTVGYFMTSSNTSLAATSTFTVGASIKTALESLKEGK